MLPPVVAVHLTTNVRTFHSASTTPVSSRPQCTDVLLLAIYNQEVVDEEGYLKQRVFRVPHLNRSSVYHEMRTGSATGTLSTGSTLLIGGQSDVFKRPDSVSSREVTVSAFGPYPEQDQINLANRNSIICALLKCFQDHLSSLPQSACAAFCRMCNRYVFPFCSLFTERIIQIF